MYDDKFGERVREARLNAGMTQKELARRLSIESDSYITNIERGRRSPNHKFLAEMGIVLNTSVDYLLYGYVRYTDLQKRISSPVPARSGSKLPPAPEGLS